MRPETIYRTRGLIGSDGTTDPLTGSSTLNGPVRMSFRPTTYPLGLGGTFHTLGRHGEMVNLPVALC